jgi:ElaB/YqjD/DUF883 family membrane-anchored ribosome-binding protein
MASTTAKSDVNGHKTTEAIARSAHEAVDRVAETAAQAEERLRKAGMAAQENLKAGSERARVKSSELADDMRTYVNDHPLTALGIAFAAGMLLTAMLRR